MAESEEPLYLLQIVEAGSPHVVARLPGGRELEADLTELFVQAIVSRGVGMFRSTTHVEQDVRDGIKTAIHSLKAQTRFMP